MCENPHGRGNLGVKLYPTQQNPEPTTVACVVCGERLPKHMLDRFNDTLCSSYCAGVHAGAAVAFGVIGMAIGDPATDGVDSSRGAEGSLRAPRGARA